MKKIDKKLIEKTCIVMGPIFTLIMYLLPWMCIYKEQYVWHNIISESTPLYRSYFDVLSVDSNTFAKVIMWISMIGLVVVATLYVLSFVLKEYENKFLKIGSIILVCSTGILFLTVFEKLIVRETVTGGKFSSWIDFMTIPYALAIIYNVTSLIYIYKKKR